MRRGAAMGWALGGLLLAAAPASAAGVGEGPAVGSRYTAAARPGVRLVVAVPDTSRRRAAAPPDTATRQLALAPDPPATEAADPEEARPTRKTILLTTLAIALLTVATLLLYNVRSR